MARVDVRAALADAPTEAPTEALERRLSPRRLMVLRFCANRGAVAGAIIVALFIAVSVLAPVLAPYDPLKQDYMAAFQGPTWAHWLGTDSFGRDMLSRILYGARISFVVGFASVGIAMVIGVVMGLAAGYYGGLVDAILMRFVDGLLSFTPLVLA
ncbi:MAG: ABC transporter permease, partial [Acidimicrobiia bacterium]